MLIESQPAFVLHTRKYTDSRVIVEFLTQDFGRVAGVARLPRSKKQSGALLAYTPYRISWRGAGQLKTITTFEVEGSALQLLGTSLYCGFYLNEILLRALAIEDPCESAFEFYQRAISKLGLAGLEGKDIEKVLRNFELDLIQELGFGLNFTTDSEQQVIEPDAQRIYQLQDGENFSPVHKAKENYLTGYYSGATLRALARRNFDTESSLKAAKVLCRKALIPVIGERPLQSREFFK